MNCSLISYLGPLIFAAGLLTAPSAPAQTAPANGLIHQWHFDETSGTTAFDSIGKSDFALSNGAFFTSGGRVGGAVQFDGVNDFILSQGLESTVLSGSFTLLLWELFVPSTNKLGLLELADGKSFLDVDLGYRDPVPQLWTGIPLKTPPAISIGDGKWHLIALIGSAGVTKLYVDSLYRQEAFSLSFSGRVSLRLGEEEGTHYFSGKIDEVSIYNRALSTSDMAAAVAPAPEPGALALIAGVILLATARRNLG